MACLLSTALLLLFSVHAHAAFYTFPAQFRLIFPSSTTIPNVASLAACLSQAAAKLKPSGFVTYDSAAKSCEYGPTVNGYILGNSTQKSGAFEGTGAASTQLTPVETEQYIMEKVYANGECPPTTKLEAGYCTAAMPNIRWGNYFAGRDANNKIYVLTKSSNDLMYFWGSL